MKYTSGRLDKVCGLCVDEEQGTLLIDVLDS
jgi:hypothetical protein